MILKFELIECFGPVIGLQVMVKLRAGLDHSPAVLRLHGREDRDDGGVLKHLDDL